MTRHWTRHRVVRAAGLTALVLLVFSAKPAGGLYGLFTVGLDDNNAVRIKVYNQAQQNSESIFQADSPTPLQFLLSVGAQTILLDDRRQINGSDSAFQAWRYQNIDIELQLTQVNPTWLVLAIIVKNNGDSPQSIGLRLVADVPDSPEVTGLSVGSVDIKAETLIAGANQTAALQLLNPRSHSQTAIVFGTQALANYAETLIVANIHRLRSLIRKPDVQEGRNFSYEPYSINDRGISLVFGDQLLMPDRQAVFLVPMTPVAPQLDDRRLNLQLNELSQALRLVRIGDASADKTDRLNSANQVLTQINDVLNQAVPRQNNYEQTLETLKTVQSQSSK